MTTGQGHIGQVDSEILATVRAVVRRISDQEINRTPGFSIAQVMQGALARCVARGQMTTSRARTVITIAVVGHYNGLGQVVDIDDALGGIGYICTGSEHEMVS
jgi:hypothetical protein